MKKLINVFVLLSLFFLPYSVFSEDDAVMEVEEILVTARKREESLLDIPESITAISGQDIDRQNIKTLDDIGFLIPNLNLSMRADGFPNVSIRGLGSFGNTQGVGFYIDDVQLFSDASSRFGDLERIEVLKGPQGVLFGGSNIGGAVKYVSKRPVSGENTGRVKVLGGDQGVIDTEVSANLSLGDAWAMRLFGFTREDDGYLVNPRTPRMNGGRSSADPDAGAYDEEGLRFSLAGPIGDNSSLYFTYRRNEYDGPVNMWTRELELPLTHPNVLDTGINPYHKRETDGYSLELTFERDGYDITSLTSYTDTFSERFTDVDLMPEFILDFLRPENMEVTTQEIRFTSTGDSNVQWIGGFYYSSFEEVMRSTQIWRDARVDADGNISGALGLAIGSPTGGGVWAGQVPTLAEEMDSLNLPFEFRNRDKVHKSAFLNITYSFDQWELGIGGRIDKWENESSNLDTGSAGSAGDTEFLPRISITRNLDDGSIVYFTSSIGMEPGGFNGVDLPGQPGTLYDFKSEEAIQHELGWKGLFMDGQGAASIAAFAIDYSDRLIEFQIPNPDGGGLIEGIFNAGDSTQFGAEAEMTIRTSEFLTLGASLGFISAEWDGGTIISGVDMSGETPPVVPNNGATFTANYLRPLTSGANFSVDFQVSHNGHFQGLQAWDPVTNPSYTLASVQIGLEKDNWELRLNVENITDEDYYVDVQYLSNLHAIDDNGSGNIIIGTLGQPQLVSASISYYFQ
ncbi:MAG: TonB-dependent receptor [SAR86 cluster bacterium]|nr:TonB-dependent receptor [SAR86 cluster bacterium]